jgi:hypothetical protein
MGAVRQWRRHLNQNGSDMIDVEEFGGGEWIQAFLRSGTGGTDPNPGTYLWLNARTLYQQAGSGVISRSCRQVTDPFYFGRCDSRKPEVRLQATGSTVVDEIIENKG